MAVEVFPPRCVAYYVTGRGLGHATRVAAVCAALAARGHHVSVVSSAPAQAFTRDIEPAGARARVAVRRAALDVGCVQSDALTVDRAASLAGYRRTAVDGRDAIVASEAAWLRATCADVVLVDCVPVACAAAAEAGVPAVCVTNFSWDFIYSDFMVSGGKEWRHIGASVGLPPCCCCV